ncbi:MAG: hypothetical protein GY715_18385 [Planctomycetes bacterium]|nr:hypothetical protein [Planctomycetota bacterium]
MRVLPLTILVVLAAAPAAWGQMPLEPVDEAVADMDPLATSTRVAPGDQRLPIGFMRLYRVPDRDDLLMRVNGGLYAVFPRSLYAQSRFGQVPLIPNDTVFHIGPTTVETLADGTPDAGAEHRAEHRVERRVDRSVAGVIPATSPPASTVQRPPPSGPTTIVNDSVYRARRVRALMVRAARAAREGWPHAARGRSSSSK